MKFLNILNVGLTVVTSFIALTVIVNSKIHYAMFPFIWLGLGLLFIVSGIQKIILKRKLAGIVFLLCAVVYLGVFIRILTM